MPRVPYEVHRAQKAAARENERGSDDARRRGSVIESETDAESLFSNTTFQSHSSSPYFPHPRSYSYSHHHQVHHPYLGARTLSSTSYGCSYPSSPSVNANANAKHLNTDSQIRQRQRDGSASPSYPGGGGRRLSSTYQTFSATQSSHPSDSLAQNSGTPLSATSSGQLDANTASTSTHGPSYRLDTYLAPPQTQHDVHRRERRERRRKEKQERSTLVGEQYDSILRRWIRWMGSKEMASWILPVALVALAFLKLVLHVSTLVDLPSLRSSNTPKLSGPTESLRDGESGERNTEESSLFTSSEPFAYGELAKFVLGEILWTWAIIAYVVREGRKGGRSWRSQVTGILTILFSPLSLFMDHSQRLPPAISIISLNLLSSSRDVLSLLLLVRAVLSTRSVHMWPYLVGLCAYLSGKSLWIGGLSGSLHSTKIAASVGVLLALSAAHCHAPVPSILRPYLAALPQHWQSTLHTAWSEAGALQSGQSGNGSFCNAFHPHVWFDTVMLNKTQTFVTALASLPPLSILLYSNLCLRPSERLPTTSSSQASRPSPTVTLVPLIIALLSIPPVVFSPSKENVVLPLVALTMMMGLRGSAGKGVDGGSGAGRGGTGEGSWLVGCAMNLLNSMILVPLSAGVPGVTVSNLSVIAWHHIIGAPSAPTALILIRQIFALITPFVSDERVSNISYSEGLYQRIAYALIWFWGMKKLIEDAWAMGGLSGTGAEKDKSSHRRRSASNTGGEQQREHQSRTAHAKIEISGRDESTKDGEDDLVARRKVGNQVL
ncbi:hypothetical protein IAU59_004558 [Kwoniella sp. CBS 9459]